MDGLRKEVTMKFPQLHLNSSHLHRVHFTNRSSASNSAKIPMIVMEGNGLAKMTVITDLRNITMVKAKHSTNFKEREVMELALRIILRMDVSLSNLSNKLQREEG